VIDAYNGERDHRGGRNTPENKETTRRAYFWASQPTSDASMATRTPNTSFSHPISSLIRSIFAIVQI